MDQLKNSWSSVRAAGSRAWSYIEEPRTHRFIWSVRYLLFTFVGIQALFFPPTSIAGVLPDGVVIVWGIMLVVGGLLGTVFALRHFWLIERVALWLTGGGALIYLVSIISLHFSSEGNRLLQAAFVIIALVAVIDRYTEIASDDFEPGF